MWRGLRSSYSSSEGLGRRLRGEVAARLGVRIQQHRPRSTGRHDTAQDSASPRTGRGPEGPGQAEARRAQDSNDAPAKSSADQQPHPGASRPCRWTVLELLWGLNTSF